MALAFSRYNFVHACLSQNYQKNVLRQLERSFSMRSCPNSGTLYAIQYFHNNTRNNIIQFRLSKVEIYVSILIVYSQ